MSISGDGGFLYGVGELATAAQHDIGLVAVVFRDDAYGNVLRMQQESTGHEIARGFRTPTWWGSPRASASRATASPTWAISGPRIEKAIESGGPAVIDVPIGPQPDLWGLLTFRERLA